MLVLGWIAARRRVRTNLRAANCSGRQMAAA